MSSPGCNKLDPTNYYTVLSIPPTASQLDIKAAYHHALLRFHPDKSAQSQNNTNPPNLKVDIALIREAYTVLSSAPSRESHDAQLQRKSSVPRPAEVISLQEFDLDQDAEEWRYSCRCGGIYRITETDMEKGVHLSGCDYCSEVIWVGYEVIEDDSEQQ